MNEVEYYKNFPMLTELDIACRFIYDGIQKINSMNTLEYESEIFSILYYIAVGIERIQKILLVLNKNITSENIREFEKELITHSHQDLHSKIKKQYGIVFNEHQNNFLQLITNFYKKIDILDLS